MIKRTPIIRDVARAVLKRLVTRRQKAFASGDYWENRYNSGGNSGAGSYNRLAEYKAQVLNNFVRQNGIGSVIEFGSGDGAQLQLAQYPRYTGVDVSRSALDHTKRLFGSDVTKRFVHTDEVTANDCADLALSLDVIYHLIEDSVFDAYMASLFDASSRYVIIYSSNTDRKSDAVHVRHRIFTDWVAGKRPDFRLIDVAKNPYPETADSENTSFADFYFFEKVDPPA